MGMCKSIDKKEGGRAERQPPREKNRNSGGGRGKKGGEEGYI